MHILLYISALVRLLCHQNNIKEASTCFKLMTPCVIKVYKIFLFPAMIPKHCYFHLYSSQPEPQILDYQTQQYKLFPLLASAYAIWFTGMKIREIYFTVTYDIMQGDTEKLPEVSLLNRVQPLNSVQLFFSPTVYTVTGARAREHTHTNTHTCARAFMCVCV